MVLGGHPRGEDKDQFCCLFPSEMSCYVLCKIYSGVSAAVTVLECPASDCEDSLLVRGVGLSLYVWICERMFK